MWNIQTLIQVCHAIHFAHSRGIGHRDITPDNVMLGECGEVYVLDWGIAIPLILGSVPGTLLGAKIAPRVPQSYIRRGIVVVLTRSGVALLDKAGWAPLGREETHPVLIAVVGLVAFAVRHCPVPLES